jgi:hypothetical protein
MSAYNNLAQGRSTVRAAKEMMRLGILDPHMVEYDKIGQVKRILPGALRGMDEYTSNPYQWMKDVLIPHMAGKGITSEKDVLNEMGAIFGNRTGSNLFSLMFLQQDKIAKNMGISKKAMDVNALLGLAKSSPQGAEMALGMAYENLHIAVGESILPIIIPGLLKLADAFRWLGQWISQHPVKFDWLIKGFAGLAAALMFSGIVLTLKAAFLGLSIVMSPLRMAFTGAATAVGSMTLALGALSAVAAAFAVAYYHKEIADAIDKRAPGIGEGYYKFVNGLHDGPLKKLLMWDAYTPSAPSDSKGFSYGDLFSGRYAGPQTFAPPASGKQVQVSTQVNLDGRQIASVITKHQANAASGPSTSGSGFDPRQSFVPAGYTGNW